MRILIKRRQWFTITAVLLGTALIVADVTLHVVEQQRIDAQHARINADQSAADAADRQRSRLEDQYATVVAEYERAYKLLQQHGVTPTTIAPSAIPGPSGAAGVAGRNGQDGRGIVSTSCTASGWQLVYSDGSTSNAGTCVGQAGPTGSAGATGSTGQAGANGTDGQDGAPGAQGPAGPAGAAGSPGRGVVSVACVLESDGSTAFRFTYTDATTSDVAGTCTATSTSGASK
ncbi:collagen-like triple helix repeat-containing protein [Curtobacterium oceanosedimentum]|uniref:collagen-like triple helix repeat-containing protein n=1 Tax=Curtobacterium oceanosedimentum TaxID=465820 RepID=UPI0033917567